VTEEPPSDEGGDQLNVRLDELIDPAVKLSGAPGAVGAVIMVPPPALSSTSASSPSASSLAFLLLQLLLAPQNIAQSELIRAWRVQ